MISKVITSDEAAMLVEQGSTIAIGASSGISLPDAVMAAIGRRFSATGAPGGLTIIFPINLGDMFGQAGLDHFSHPGMVTCLVGGSYPSGPSNAEPPAIRRRIGENSVRAFNYPIGHITAMLAESAAKGIGFMTETGLGSFIDPRCGGGGLNPLSKAAPWVQLANFGGREVLYYPPAGVDVSIIRATTADERGNLTFEEEGALISPFTLSAVARTSGGKVIAQVKRLRSGRKLNPRDVHVPGYMIDAVVVAPDQMQATLTPFDPAISGQDWADPMLLSQVEDPLDAFVARRAAGRIARGEVAVLGFGVCANIPTLLARTGELDDVSFVIEQGAVGGIPLTGFRFGCAYNATAYLDTRLGFDYLRGGGFDVALLSFLQVDGNGNINVSSVPSKPHITAGIGGFMDIAYNAPRLVFAGQFRSGGADVTIDTSGLRIIREGRHAKIVGCVDEVTVPGEVLRRDGRSVCIVTERCSFELGPNGLALVEIVEGIDVQRDVIALCGAPVEIAADLTISPAVHFNSANRRLLRAGPGMTN